MSRIRKQRVWTALLSVLALSMLLIAPASADSAVDGHYVAAEAACQGNANLGAGLSLPTDGDTQTTWEFNTQCTVVLQTTNGEVTANGALTASGTVDGSCGSSTGEGTYTVKLDNGDVVSGSLTWQSAGSLLVVTGDHDAPGPNSGTLTAEVQATPENPDDCLTGDADTFVVTVAAELT